MRVVVLRNSRSGSSGRRRFAASLAEGLRDGGATVELESPESAEALRDRASALRRADCDLVVVAGGDGTLHVAANALVETPKSERPALAILPSGRGNDFAAALGLRSVDDTLAAITRGRRLDIDLGKTDAGVFLSVAGTGFDAQVARGPSGRRCSRVVRCTPTPSYARSSTSDTSGRACASTAETMTGR